MWPTQSLAGVKHHELCAEPLLEEICKDLTAVLVGISSGKDGEKWRGPRIPGVRLMREDNWFCAICCSDGCQTRMKHVSICIIMHLYFHEQNGYNVISLLQTCSKNKISRPGSRWTAAKLRHWVMPQARA